MDSAVGAGRQAGDADSGAACVADIHADEQGGDLFDDACVFKLAAVDGAHPGDFGRQFAGELHGIGVVTAHHDVAVEWRVGADQVGGNVMEGSDYAYFIGDDLGGLLGGGALPDAKGARGATSDVDCQGHGGVNENAACGYRGFEFLEKRGLTFEGNGEHQDVRGGAGSAVFHARYFGLLSNSLLDGCGCLLSALFFRSEEH